MSIAPSLYVDCRRFLVDLDEDRQENEGDRAHPQPHSPPTASIASTASISIANLRPELRPETILSLIEILAHFSTYAVAFATRLTNSPDLAEPPFPEDAYYMLGHDGQT